MGIDWETGREYEDHPPQPTVPNIPSQPPPPSSGYSPQERDAAHQAFRSHVGRQTFLQGKVGDEDYVKATGLYAENRKKNENHGDAVNHAISALHWDDPRHWQTTADPTDSNNGNEWSDLWNSTGKNPQSFVSAYISRRNLRGAQADPRALNEIVSTLKSLGVSAELDSRSDGLHKGIMLNGQFIKMLDGHDNWIWLPGGDGGGETEIPGVPRYDYPSQFDDPSTQQFEHYLMERMRELGQPVHDPSREALARLLEQQTAYFEQQRQAQIEANKALQARKAQAQQSLDKMLAYVNERATKLQGPAYTGTEQEILRTQALDPIENDRQASLKRALDNIGSRGFDPSSGIAQDLLLRVNASYDRERNASQNDIAVRQVEEQRSREQEAQQLLQYIPQAQDAAARGDLEFLQMLDAAVNAKGMGAIATANQSAMLGQAVRSEEEARRDELLARSGQLYMLPAHAAQLGMSALGLAGNPADLIGQSIQLAQLSQHERQSRLQNYLNMGSAIAGFF
jgi:hypothetical protein